jgi:hypothetical protein
MYVCMYESYEELKIDAEFMIDAVYKKQNL